MAIDNKDVTLVKPCNILATISIYLHDLYCFYFHSKYQIMLGILTDSSKSWQFKKKKKKKKSIYPIHQDTC